MGVKGWIVRRSKGGDAAREEEKKLAEMDPTAFWRAWGEDHKNCKRNCCFEGLGSVM